MILKKSTYQILTFLILGMVLNACIEPFEIENKNLESALVVEATLSDEKKQQTILLSRAYEVASEGPNPETGAQVKVVDDTGNEYGFIETEAGRYESSQIFAARSGSSYVLSIKTADGSTYTSEPETAPDAVPITNLYAEREFNDLGEEGVNILLDNEAPTGEPKYFRFEYEETYKIIAPNWTPFEYDIIDDDLFDGDFYQVGLKAEEEGRQICYKSNTSVDIKQVSTASLGTNEVSRFSVRFLHRENYVISHRYSILVKQYSQTPKAFFYFQKLDDFASSESVFTDIQAGFLEGNVHSDTNRSEKVIGYFEVATFDSKRLYFNYSDLFPGEIRPNYPVACELELNIPLYSMGFHVTTINGVQICDGACESPLINAIRSDDIAYFLTIPGFEGLSDEQLSYIAPFLSKAKGCVDCRVLGSNIKPDFWEDE